MGSLMSLYDLSQGALLADQQALSATANNVANQNTAGYTREVVTFQAGDSVTLSDGATVGASAPVATTTSARDRVLDQRVEQQTQLEAASAARSGVLGSVQNVFDITGNSTAEGSTEIGTSLDGLFSAFTSLASEPSDAPTQQSALAAAGTLAGAFNAAASQLGQVQAGINSDLSSSVGTVNTLTATIAQLNAQIASTSPNGDAGTLEDQRQQAITQLSGYIGLDQIQTENNGITLTTTSGVDLVSGASSTSLSAANVGGTTRILDSTGSDISSQITGGSIGGELTSQNVDLPSVNTQLDNLAYRIATAVNTQNEAGLTTSGTAGGAIFSLPTDGTATGAAAAISVIPTDASAIASAGAGEGATGNTNALALAAIASATDANGETADSQLAALLSGVGTTSSAVGEQNTAQQTTLTDLTNQQSSLSGVSLDQEASNLSQFQQAYNAAAKLFSVVDSVTVTALNLGQETTYS